MLNLFNNALRFFLRVTTLLLVLITAISPAAPYDPDLGNEIDAFLTGKKSPIAGNGSVFFNSGVAHDVDPRLILAIAGQESSYGTVWKDCPESGFNAWSWFWGRNPQTCANSPFASFADGIERVSKGISRWMVKYGRTTIPVIKESYCPDGGLCSNWISGVTNIYQSPGLGGGGDTNDLTFNELIFLNFDDRQGPSQFGSAQPPLTIDIATFSGGELLTNATFGPADSSTIYGTSYFCGGCANAITIDFSQPVSNFSVWVINGETITITYKVQDNLGGMQTVTLVSNIESGFGTVKLPSEGIRQVKISPLDPTNWDFAIDDVRFAPSKINAPSS